MQLCLVKYSNLVAETGHSQFFGENTVPIFQDRCHLNSGLLKRGKHGSKVRGRNKSQNILFIVQEE